MPCTLTITSAVVNGTTISVFGTYNSASPCQPVSIGVTVTFPDGSTCSDQGTPLSPGSIYWSMDIYCSKPCGYGPVVISATAACFDPNLIPPTVFCAVTSNLPLLCCCPTPLTSIVYGACNNNSQIVSFNTTVNIPNPGCTFSIRRDFGDSSLGSIHTFTGSGIFTIPTEQHSYASPGIYTTTIAVLPPPQGCGRSLDPQQVVVNCSNSPCYSSNLLKFLCEFFEFSFLLSSTVGIVLAIVLLPALYLVYVGFFSMAATFLALFYLSKCDKCICDPFTRAWGRIMISVGIILFMFIIPGGSLIPAPVAFALGVASIASGFIVLQVWYNQNHTSCALTFCDVWCLIGNNTITTMNNISAINLAILSGLIVWGITGASATGFGLVLLVVILIWGFINNKLTNSPCGSSTSKYTCK
ncbi:MAG: hypothetical protein ACKVT2_03440 [Saprospiraceae bacterium]